MSKKISIICPVYNTAEYLHKCIQSVLDQTYKNIELILIDDGSTDGSEKIVDEFAAKDSRIVARHQSNAGECAARNAGLELATGELWGFLDCDDWLELDMYETLYNALTQNDVDVACGGWFEEFPDDPKPVGCFDKPKDGVFGSEDILYYLYRRDRYRAFGFMWDKLFRKELFVDTDGSPLRFDTSLVLGGDIIYLAKLLVNVKRAVYVDRPFYHYRQRITSGSYSTNVKNRMGAIYAYLQVIELLEAKGYRQETIDYAKRFLAFHCMLISKPAIEQNDKEHMKELSYYMRRFKEDYYRMNAEYPERTEEFEEILAKMSELVDEV